jgi:SAM-dependent MidA family methyltransferase
VKARKTLAERLRDQIVRTGPISIEAFTRSALYDPEAGYYATREDILGGDGDFITSPEVSQMFGELIGLWAASEWDAIGRPDAINFIELGAGRGLLMSDALRAINKVAPAFREAAQVVFVEVKTRRSERFEQPEDAVGRGHRHGERLGAVAIGADGGTGAVYFDPRLGRGRAVVAAQGAEDGR